MFICKSQYFVMQNEQKFLLLYMYKAFDCGILVDECLSHNVYGLATEVLVNSLKVHFKIFLQHEGCFLKHFVLYEPFCSL